MVLFVIFFGLIPQMMEKMDSVLPLGVLDTAGGKILVLNSCIKII
jgi:hypothetical protein